MKNRQSVSKKWHSVTLLKQKWHSKNLVFSMVCGLLCHFATFLPQLLYGKKNKNIKTLECAKKVAQ